MKLRCDEGRASLSFLLYVPDPDTMSDEADIHIRVDVKDIPQASGWTGWMLKVLGKTVKLVDADGNSAEFSRSELHRKMGESAYHTRFSTALVANDDLIEREDLGTEKIIHLERRSEDTLEEIGYEGGDIENATCDRWMTELLQHRLELQCA